MVLKPSIIGLWFSGLLIGLALYYLIREFYSGNTINGTKLIDLTLFLSTAISLHSILHLGLEVNYNYNPLTFIGL
jgi:hypothetical protein